MKLLRYGPRGQEKPGLLDRDGKLRDLSGVIADLTPDNLAPAALERLRKLDPATLPPVGGTPRIGACVAGVPKLVCVGLNYRDHADETNNPHPEGAGAVPEGDQLDQRPQRRRRPAQGLAEGRLGGRARHRHRHAPRAMSPSATGSTMSRAIASSTTCPSAHFQIGARRPMDQGQELRHVLPDRALAGDRPTRCRDPQALELICEVSGEIMQKGTTRNMIFTCAQIVSYISQFMTLAAGRRDSDRHARRASGSAASASSSPATRCASPSPGSASSARRSSPTAERPRRAGLGGRSANPGASEHRFALF